MLRTYGQLKSSFDIGGVEARIKALFPQNVNKAKIAKLNGQIIFINSALFAKRAYAGKIIYRVWIFNQTSDSFQVQFVREEE